MLRLLAAQAAVAIEHAGLRTRMNALPLSDPLTGLATRRVWDEELPRELARARRSDSPLALAVVDIDHMSAFNMLRGEREGDRLIKETASRWRGELREVDMLARLEGTEFGILLPGCALGEAVDVLDRVRGRHPARPDRLGGRRPLGRRGAGRAAARPRPGCACGRQGDRPQHHHRRRLDRVQRDPVGLEDRVARGVEPGLARAVVGQLDPVAVGVVEVDRDGAAVVGGVVDRVAVVLEAADGAGELAAVGIVERDRGRGRTA